MIMLFNATWLVLALQAIAYDAPYWPFWLAGTIVGLRWAQPKPDLVVNQLFPTFLLLIVGAGAPLCVGTYLWLAAARLYRRYPHEEAFEILVYAVNLGCYGAAAYIMIQLGV